MIIQVASLTTNHLQRSSRLLSQQSLTLATRRQYSVESSGISRKPSKYNSWKDPNKQFQFLEDVAKKLNIKTHEDWYNVHNKDVIDHGGRGLLEKYGTKVKLLQAVYPQFTWDESKFKKLPTGYWRNEEAQRKFFDMVAEKLNITKQEDWFVVSSKQIESLGGKSVMNVFNGSLFKALSTVYPEQDWDRLKFYRNPRGHWSSLNNQRGFLAQLEKKLYVDKIEDWSNVTVRQIRSIGGGALLNRYKGSLYRALVAAFPEQKWSRFSKITYQKRPASKDQVRLYNIAKRLFPFTNVYINYRLSDITYTTISRQVEFDIFIPSLALAIEYHGEIHYLSIPGYGNHKRRQQIDAWKADVAQKYGITLVQIPFWWDKDPASIIATLTHYRPDLIIHGTRSSMVPLDPPEKIRASM